MKNQRTNWLIATLAMSTILAPNSFVSAASAATDATQKTVTSATPSLLFHDLQGVSAERQDSIRRAVQAGLLHGDSSGSFRPADTLTREEMAVLLTQALQLPLGSTASTYSDVQPNGWASRYIEAVRNAGMMVGDGNGSFRPTDFINREELAVLLMRAAQLPLSADATDSSSIKDWNGISPWAQPFVNTALQAGAMQAVETGFQPSTPVQRQDIAEMLLATFFPTERPAFLQRVEDGKVWINGVAYQLSDSVKGVLHPENSAILQGAKVQFTAVDRTIKSITKLELHASGQAAAAQSAEFSGNLTLDGHGATLDGDLILAGNYLTVSNLTVAHDFQITPELTNDFSAHHLQVQGKTLIQGGDQDTVLFEASQLQSVEVSKQDVHVVALGNSSVQQMTLSSDATITNDSTSTLQQVTLATGAQQVNLQGSVKQVVINSAQATTLTGQAEIGNVVVNSSAPVTLNSTGTVGNLQVNNAASSVKVSSNTKVSNVSLAAGVPAAAVSGATPSVGITNTAPILLSSIPNQFFTVGDSDLQIDASAYFTDAEQSALLYGVSPTNSTICKATVTGTIINLTALSKGTVTISVIADDQVGKRTGTNFKVTVNAPPASAGILDQTKILGTGDVSLSLNTLFTDADNDPLTYQVTVADPTIATFNLTSDQLTLTPAQVGSTAVTVKATDGRGGVLTKTFQLQVAPVPNQQPVVQQTPSNQALTVGSADYTLDLAPLFQDPDNDALTYEVVSSDPTKATVSVTGTQATVHALTSGTTTIQLKAKDGRGGEVTTSFDVTVNDVPAISALPAQTLQVGDAPTVLDLSSYLSDPDNDTLTLSAVSANTNIATVSVTNQQLTLTPLAAGQTTVTVTVDDGHGGVTSAPISVTVTAAPGPVGNNQAPVAVSTIYEQVLTSGVTNARSFDLTNLFQDGDGDTMTFTAIADTPQIANISVAGSMLTLTPDSVAGSTTVTITADDGHGGTATYNFAVRNAPTVSNGYIEIATKQGVADVSYDLSTLFPGQTSFKVYEGTPDSTFTGPTTLSGKVWTGTAAMPYVWLVGADGRSVVLHVTSTPQGAPELFFSEYLDGGDGRIAIELFYKGDGDPAHKAEGYEIEVHQYMKATNSMNVWTRAIFPTWPNMPYIFIDSIFYDAFDITNITYYNDELSLYNPQSFNTVALVLKKNGQVVDVLGDPNSHNQFLPNGGTIIRKQGIFTGSQAFGLYGEWNLFPKDTYQFLGRHTL
ncbi:S-layer homology domain-containing protein [Tumebacillus permanentifrigoris]|uniref:Ig-like protein group 2 n=1 Tax=Tumebacillus permanentifrigoris TaxID=378543 RepID=A0A316DAR8_9BACL|nr:S-layer homology domain-containing protein [Tumebacillus permanentifrigoris]PWK14902.1 Ig-like protein group 2 [Tumebacillus permanentifrigoris]